jgi:putative FmdB family regulatory protein
MWASAAEEVAGGGGVPLYEYRCEQCERRFELLRRVGQSSEGLVCPHCGDARVEKEHSTFASAGASAGGGCAPGGRFT